MATLNFQGSGTYLLGSAQTGNVDTTNTIDRGGNRGPAALVVTSTVGGTPTVTVNIQGSADGTNFFNIPYALVATPSTFVVAAITTTTTNTITYLLQPNQGWNFLKLNISALTTETVQATAYL